MSSLQFFDKEDFYQSGVQLFSELKIPLKGAEDQIYKPTDVLGAIYSTVNPAHLLIDEIYILGLVDDEAFENITEEKLSLEQIAKIPSDYPGLLIIGVKLNDRINALLPSRSQLAEITRALNRSFDSTPVTVLFQYGDYIALANAERLQFKLKSKDGEKAGKVTMLKDISIENTKAAHLKIIFGDKNSAGLKISSNVETFGELYKYWQKQFTVQSLNDQFYRDLQSWFYYAASHIVLPYKPDFVDEKENVKNFLVRLLSRTIFCWFIKEKGLISKELLELKDWKGNYFPITFDSESPNFLISNSYYRGILQNIFFFALNVKDKDKSKFKYKKYLPIDFDFSALMNIPYLNGGIFDQLPEDNAKDTIEDSVIKIPNYLFYGKDELQQQSKGKGKNAQETLQNVHHKGLNEILSEYKFTLAENTPFEEDIALDPEMLGLVFENLLAELDPNLEESTKKSIRNLTGSYYTPRKIIHEMVNDSLNIYLCNYLDQNAKSLSNIKDQVSDLVYYGNVSREKDFNNAIVDALDQYKFLDPACGSGAFPLVALHRMTDILKLVDPDNKVWVKLKLKKVDAPQKQEFEKILTQHLDDYGRKLGIIRDSIYGIDIQPMAVQITKLRFFISLLIDQTDGAEITPMPNIETKIICADSLKNVKPDLFSAQAIKDLKLARNNYYQPANTKEEKERIGNEIVDILDSAFPDFATKVTGKEASVRNKALLKDWLEHGTIAAPFFNLDFFFPEIVDHGGFDCVMGNPPYGGFKIEEEVRQNLNIVSKDPYGAFVARFINSGDHHQTPLKEGGVLAYIISDTFMTIKSHYNLRKHLMSHKVHKMLRVHPDTFRATVNTAIILVEKLPLKSAITDHVCLMADLTNISIHDNYDHFMEILAQTRGTDFALNQNISTTEFGIYFYPQSLIKTNSNLPFFVATPKLFRLMNDGNDKSNVPKSIEKQIGQEKVRARIIELNGKKAEVVKLGFVEKVGKGMDSKINYVYRASANVPVIRTTYEIVDKNKIRSNSAINSLNLKEQLEGVDGNDFVIPFNKGGSSDSGGGWLPNYFVPIEYYIDWSKKAVDEHYHRNKDLYFLKGLTYSFRGEYSPTFRLKNIGPFDANSSFISSVHFNENYLIGILSSKFIRFLFNAMIQHTVASDIDKIKEIPIIISKENFLEKLILIIINKQKKENRYDYASHEQIEIDQLVYDAYSLNAEDVEEVENWYARRYPKLSAAQKSNLRALGKSDDYLELYGLRK
ncbi:BREX-1 system adenine-specific DNA-methyltransferase PglX [Kaistella sp. 97-N-M2]|uniref:BREX-1 system adenine-specific DNA-methyltransferase PglX n=1 Tax=Kaistella sp. 97-N-M2 TaxID=2908645 RepID=UPI001F4769F3|nr:BREX-1 system adenine-specific DNA-methyltransferase PglX [Kaistella sp. 97-N-M2]UJF29568.1 BREX-1 system adenine-specific DNA-methyltransferase PglX [Kaistella sp. 97-N-M2]